MLFPCLQHKCRLDQSRPIAELFTSFKSCKTDTDACSPQTRQCTLSSSEIRRQLSFRSKEVCLCVPSFFKLFNCRQEKSMAKSQSATKCVRCVPFIINVTTLHATATVKTSKWLPWRYVTQDAAKNIPLLSYHDKYFIIWRLTMMVSNAISQQVSSCEHYGYLMDCLMVTFNVPFVNA